MSSARLHLVVRLIVFFSAPLCCCYCLLFFFYSFPQCFLRLYALFSYSSLFNTHLFAFFSQMDSFCVSLLIYKCISFIAIDTFHFPISTPPLRSHLYMSHYSRYDRKRYLVFNRSLPAALLSTPAYINDLKLTSQTRSREDRFHLEINIRSRSCSLLSSFMMRAH